MIEDALRAALADPARALPTPADPVGWVHRRVRRQRTAQVLASSVATLLVVLGGLLLVPGREGPGREDAGPVARGTTLGWAPRGPLASDRAVAQGLQRAWDEAVGSPGEGGELPARTGPVRVLWAGRPDPLELVARGPARAALVEAPTAQGAWVLSAAGTDGSEQPWTARSWARLPDEAPELLLLDVPPDRLVNGRSSAEVHVLAAPGTEVVDARQDAAWVRLPQVDGLFGPALVQPGSRVSPPAGTEAVQRLVVRAGGRLLAEPCGDRLGPLLAPVRTSAAAPPAGWSPLGTPVDDGLLGEDALLLVGRRCTERAGAALLWSGTLPASTEQQSARVVALSRPGAEDVAALVDDRGSASSLVTGTADPVVLALLGRGIDTVDLVAVGDERVARMVVEGGEPVEARGRVLVHRSEYGGIATGTLVAYDADGRELLRRRVSDPAWQAQG